MNLHRNPYFIQKKGGKINVIKQLVQKGELKQRTQTYNVLLKSNNSDEIALILCLPELNE